MNQDSYNHLGKWQEDVVKVAGTLPTVCGNKVELKGRVVKSKTINFHWNQPQTQYYDISGKSNYNSEKPFLWLLRKLTGHQDLKFSNKS